MDVTQKRCTIDGHCGDTTLTVVAVGHYFAGGVGHLDQLTGAVIGIACGQAEDK